MTSVHVEIDSANGNIADAEANEKHLATLKRHERDQTCAWYQEDSPEPKSGAR